MTLTHIFCVDRPEEGSGDPERRQARRVLPEAAERARRARSRAVCEHVEAQRAPVQALEWAADCEHKGQLPHLYAALLHAAHTQRYRSSNSRSPRFTAMYCTCSASRGAPRLSHIYSSTLSVCVILVHYTDCNLCVCGLCDA